MKKEDFIYLIYKQYRGTITADEADNLEYWLSASADHRKIKQEVLLSMQLLNDYEPKMDIDLDEDYQALEAKMGDIEESTAPQGKVISIKKWMYAAASVAVILGGFFFLQGDAQDAEWQWARTEAGETKEIKLSDGSTAWLNESSTIKYPPQFGNNDRKLVLTGQAFFEVTKDASRPFQVTTAESVTTVLGTSFDIDATQAGQTTILVKTGKVKFEAVDSESESILTPYQKAVLTHNTDEITNEKVTNLNALAWHSNKVSFRSTPIAEVITSLAEQFDTEIDMTNLAIQSCPVTITPQEADVERILNSLKISHKISIVKRGSKYEIAGGEC